MVLHKGRVFTLLIILSILSVILYSLANRYLFEHVEVANVSSMTSENSVMVTTAESTTEVVTGQDSVDTTVNSISDDTDAIEVDEPTITIEKVEMGSGNSMVTYYVADVILGDATQLMAAFADDAFGSNIIDYTSSIAEDNDAVFAINGDYYGFRDDGIIIRNGIVFRNSPARTGLAIYYDGTMKVYDETATDAEALIDAGVMHTYSFGPGLITDGEIIDGIDDMEVDTNFGNHSIQGNQPRTAIGMIDANHFVFVVVDGRSKGYSAGLDMNELAEVMYSLGCTEAYNLDGGGSSTMYFDGSLVNNPLGKNKERGTSDILMIGGAL